MFNAQYSMFNAQQRYTDEGLADGSKYPTGSVADEEYCEQPQQKMIVGIS